MKRILAVSVACLMLCGAVAFAEVDQETLIVTNIALDVSGVTNTTDISPSGLYGFIDTVIIEVLTTATVATVELITYTNTWSDSYISLYHKGNVNTNVEFRPRVGTELTNDLSIGLATNGNERILLIGEKLKLRTYGANRSNTSIRAKVKLWQ